MNTADHLRQIDSRLDEIEQSLNSVDLNAVAVSGGGMWRRFQEWAADNKLAVSVIALLTLAVTVLGIFATPIYERHLRTSDEARNQAIDGRIDAKLGPLTTHLSDIDTKISTLQSSLDTLKPFVESLVQREMQRSAQQSQLEFQQTLPFLSDTLAAAESQRAIVDAATLLQLSKKVLAASPENTGYWPAASRLISYRSQVLTNWSNAQPEQLADCLDQMPIPTKVIRKFDQMHLELSPAIYRHCRVSLDSPEDARRINSLLWNYYWRLLFEDCVVEYHGRPVRLILAWNHDFSPAPSGKNTVATILFRNCRFSFSSAPSPVPTGFELARQLLAQNGTVLSLTVKPLVAGE